MARAKADLPAADIVAALIAADGRLALRVTPGAREEAVAIADGRLSLKVRARPADGEANEAVIALLARVLGVPRSSIELLRGATSREKLLRVRR